MIGMSRNYLVHYRLSSGKRHTLTLRSKAGMAAVNAQARKILGDGPRIIKVVAL